MKTSPRFPSLILTIALSVPLDAWATDSLDASESAPTSAGAEAEPRKEASSVGDVATDEPIDVTTDQSIESSKPTSDAPTRARNSTRGALGSVADGKVTWTSTEEFASPRAAWGQPIGRVVSIREGLVILRKFPDVTVTAGSRVAFHDEEGDETIVGTLEKVNIKTYHVGVSMNEDVRVGDVAYSSTSAESGSLVGPPDGHYTWSVGGQVKPWLGLSGDESGALLEGFVTTRLSERFRLRVAAEPSSPPIGSTPGALEAYGALSVVFRWAEVGFGVGAGTANFHRPNPPGIGLLFTPTLRVGSEDGLVFRARSSAVIHRRQAVFGSFRIDVEIPVAYGTKLLAGGGGGESGYAFGEIGLKKLMVGNGGAGSWFAQVTFGGAGVQAWTSTAGEDGVARTAHEGPFMGIGAERRF